ncbi:MAG: DUF167 domain-containing protein [archaeon]|nr:DUF167 domain-containing protein [Nanoarchaeota archaeon]
MLTKTKLKQYINNNLLKLKVIPNSSKLELVEEIPENTKQKPLLKLYLKAVPDKNKANLELIKFFKKEYQLKVEIKSGTKSREKTIRILQ